MGATCNIIKSLLSCTSQPWSYCQAVGAVKKEVLASTAHGFIPLPAPRLANLLRACRLPTSAVSCAGVLFIASHS